MNKVCVMLALATAVLAGTLAGEDGIRIYRGPNIGTQEHPRKVFENVDLSGFRIRAAANGSYYSATDYDIINGAGRTVYLPISQTHATVGGTNRLTAVMQSLYKYSTNSYQTLQMNVVLEQRGDDVYAWCDTMYQSASSAGSVHQPYSWMYFGNLGRDFGAVGNACRVRYGTIGYDWRDLSGDENDFYKGFGIDNIILGPENEAEILVSDLSGDLAVTGNFTIENPGSVTCVGTFTGGGDLTYRATAARKMPDTIVKGEVVTACEQSCITKTWVTVATDRRLSQMTNIVVDTFGTRTGKTTGGYGHWKNDGLTASVQVYGVVGSAYQAGSVLQFRQSGSDIEASIYEAYTYDKPWERGYDKDTYRYGDIDFIAENEKDPTQETGCATISIATGDVASGTPNGRAGLKNLRMYFADEQLPSVSVGADVYLKGGWMTVATGRLLSTLTNVTAVTCGTRTGVAVPAAYGHWRNNGNRAAVQVYKKVSDSWQTGSVLRFRQCGRDVQALIQPYSYNNPWQNGYDEATYRYGDIDFEVCAETITDTSVFQSLSVATADDAGQSGLKDLKLFFDENQPQFVEAAGLNNMTTGAVVRVCGTGSAKMWLMLNHTADGQGLPKDGTLDVGSNGIVTIAHMTQPKRVYVHDGGIVYQATNNVFLLGAPMNVSLDNGRIFLGGSPIDTTVRETGSFAYTALHTVLFANGSDIVGHTPRIGYGTDIYPLWRVTGASPSCCSAGVMLYDAPSFVLDVEDVTGTPETDFTLGGSISRNVINNADKTTVAATPVVKIGSGTVSVTATLAALRPSGLDYGLTVTNGTWRFASDTSSNDSLDVLLTGGTLAVATNVVATLGTLGVTAPVTIALEAGATISLAALSETLASGEKLCFEGEGARAQNAVRIGTTACLTGAQRAKIRVNGSRVIQDANGYLNEVGHGLMLLVK